MWTILAKSLVFIVILFCCIAIRGDVSFSPISAKLLQYVEVANEKKLKNGHNLLSNHKNLLNKLLLKSYGLKDNVINHLLAILNCASDLNIEHNNILSIIDYSLPANKKRLWIIDLTNNKLLFHTYVSHGIKTGALFSKYFSNRVNSKASSIGVYQTENSYYGRHGLSLKLRGLDKGFNHNAYRRFIVMHGSWYVTKNFIDKYGRSGRSWGCPAIPRQLTKSIINTIKDQSLLVIYYPRYNWLYKSKFFNCNSLIKNKIHIAKKQSDMNYDDKRKNVLFVDINDNDKRERDDPVISVSAAQYKLIFAKKPPLKRMLRRRIDNMEYIVLTHSEFKYLYNTYYKSNNFTKFKFKFIIPVVKKLRGFYATEMKIINLGNLNKVAFHNTKIEDSENYQSSTLYFKNKPSLKVKMTRHFIRWLGL